MTKIHHATQKLADKHGIVIEPVDGEFRALFDGHFVLAGSAKDAVAEMVEAIENETVEDLDLLDDEAAEEEVDETEESRSVITPKYRAIYKPHDDTNGDDLNSELREYLRTETEDGDERIDRDLLERFGRANGCWVDTYASLNPGMARMNVGNRLRAKMRKDPKFKVQWVD